MTLAFFIEQSRWACRPLAPSLTGIDSAQCMHTMHAHNACTPIAVSTSNACARSWLQVCPLSVISNWETQIEEHSGGTLSCIRYHGAARFKHAPSELAAADVVVTTYGIMASDKMLLKRVSAFSWSVASIWTLYVFWLLFSVLHFIVFLVDFPVHVLFGCSMLEIWMRI